MFEKDNYNILTEKQKDQIIKQVTAILTFNKEIIRNQDEETFNDEENLFQSMVDFSDRNILKCKLKDNFLKEEVQKRNPEQGSKLDNIPASDFIFSTDLNNKLEFQASFLLNLAGDLCRIFPSVNQTHLFELLISVRKYSSFLYNKDESFKIPYFSYQFLEFVAYSSIEPNVKLTPFFDFLNSEVGQI